MLVVENTENFRIEKPSILTIGTFDGVHLGHQKLLGRLKELKAIHGLQTVILTFDPHPRRVLFPEQKDLKLITNTREKLKLLEEYGIDIAVVYPFTKEFSKLDSESYISELLCKKLKVKHLVIGYDHRFGNNRSGDIKVLQKYAPNLNFEVEEISAKDIDSIAISSSKIRQAIDDGNVELANTYLGHAYSLKGKVIKGKQLGRTIGYPTANIDVNDQTKLLPKTGVYWVKAEIENETHFGMLNIGKNPTTDSDDLLKIEVNLFNFDKDIYGKLLQVSFLKRIRDEIKFNSLKDLTDEIGRDKQTCLKWMNEKHA